MSFADAGHRPHGTHFNEEPENRIQRGPKGITVTLDTWGPQENLFPTLYDMLQSNWGDAPSRAPRDCRPIEGVAVGEIARWSDKDRTGWAGLLPDQQAYVESLFAGRTLPQAKELISFSFLVDGVSRTCTHQLVRTRIGASFMQHGGRDNDWRHRSFRLPETVGRAIDSGQTDGPEREDLHKDCITDWDRIIELVGDEADDIEEISLRGVLDSYLERGRRIYAALVDAGIPWQDARFFLPEGMTTYIHCNYTYAALEGVLANRLEHVMQWEINCVAQLMLREIKMKCPPLLSKYLGSRSDKTGRDAFAGLESWPPTGKHPAPPEAGDLPRTHRPEQNPFWVLHPDSMAGGPVVWVPTNGTYPKEF